MILKYRPEIDGLRAIAVLAVIFYHAGIFFKGGYFGVDIFFVISGYLISLIILKELAEDDSFSFAMFYERRARRILPVLSLIISISILVAWFCMDGIQLKEFGLTLLAVSSFTSNFVFWQNSGYFAAPADLLPMLHTWSLALEEQFYIAFPIFLFICWKYTRQYLISIITFSLLGSLLIADWSSQDYVAPDAAFYLLHTRGWELLAGAIIAKFELDVGRHPNKILDAVMPTTGIFLIAYAIVFYDSEIQHPSFFTVIPIFGSVIIIWFCKPGELVSNILASRVFVGVGLISYSLYLWHFPFLVFLRLFNIGELPAHTNYWLLPILFILSILSWKYVEAPFRDKNRVSSRNLIKIMLGVWSLIIVTGTIFYLYDGFPKRMDFPKELEKSFEMNKELKECNKRFSSEEEFDKIFCSISKKKHGNIDFMLFGDSHANAAISGFKQFADANNLRGNLAFGGACPPLLGYNRSRCETLINKIYNYVENNNIKTVFLVSNWGFLFLPMVDAETGISASSKSELSSLIEKSFKYTVKQYNKIGVKVVFMGRVPTQNYKAREIYKNIYMLPEYLREKALNELHVKRNNHREYNKYFHTLFSDYKSDNIAYLDPTDYFCDEDKCPVGSLVKSLYWDHDHISNEGAKHIFQLLEDNKRLYLQD